MIRFVLALAATGAAALLHGQIGQPFPQLHGETLDGRQLVLPEATKGKITIIGMAYAKKAEETLNTWYTPFYDKFILKRGIFDHNYDVNLLFIPMFSGIKKATYDVNLKELRSGSRQDLHPYLLFYKGAIDSYVAALKMSEKDHPYFFVLDENGIIRSAQFGMFTEKKMEQIEEILDEGW